MQEIYHYFLIKSHDPHWVAEAVFVTGLFGSIAALLTCIVHEHLKGGRNEEPRG